MVSRASGFCAIGIRQISVTKQCNGRVLTDSIRLQKIPKLSLGKFPWTDPPVLFNSFNGLFPILFQVKELQLVEVNKKSTAATGICLRLTDRPASTTLPHAPYGGPRA
jgi:hypothetical protein